MSEDYKRSVRQFLASKTISEIPTKNVIVVSADQPISDAFRVLIDNNIQSAPVQESDGSYIGFLDVRDLVQFVVMLHDAESVTDDTTLQDIIERTEISTSDFAKKNRFAPVSPSDSVLEGAELLVAREVHRLAVIDNGALINIISQSDIIKLIASEQFQDTSLIRDHHEIGNPAIVIPMRQSLIDTFRILGEKRITGVPLVDDNGRLVACSSGKDLKLFLRNPALSILRNSVFENLKHVRAEDSAYEMALTVSVTEQDTVARAIQLLAATGVHRLFVVDNNENYHPKRAVSFNDLLIYILGK